MRATIVGLAVLLSAGTATARCLSDTLQSKTDDGSTLVMSSGVVYSVLPGDEVDSTLWLPLEDVTICEDLIPFHGRTVMTYEIINGDEHEKVGALRLGAPALQ